MIIAIPVEGNTENVQASRSFARAPYVMFYDTEKKQAQYVDNSVIAKSQGGAGIRAAQAMIDKGVTAVLAQQCGRNAATTLSAANIRIYRIDHASAMENIEAFVRGELSELTQIHSGFHRHGGV